MVKNVSYTVADYTMMPFSFPYEIDVTCLTNFLLKISVSA